MHILEAVKEKRKFTIKEICSMCGLKYGHVWGYIKYHSNLFSSEAVHKGTKGRPMLIYTYKGE